MTQTSTTILIVDDDPTSTILLESILRKEGFLVLKAASGAEGRQIARREMPDLILLDRRMPGEDGLETCQMLKHDPVTSPIPVIFISGDDDVAGKVTAFESGAVDYIVKPYQRAEVLARARLHLRLVRANQFVIESLAAKLRDIGQAQQALLVQPADIPEAGFAVRWKPCHEAGGDFYDVIRISDHIWDYMVADIAGHEVEASLATAALKALVRQNASPSVSPADLVGTVNDVMNRVYPEGPFTTLVYARLNRARHVLSVVIAGHPPLIHLPKDKELSLISTNSEIIGAFSSVHWVAQEINVHAGDRILLYTDGLIEADTKGAISRQVGMERLRSICESRRNQPLPQMVDEIITELLPATGVAPDDLLLLGIEV